MAVTIIPYKGFELRAAAFEVPSLNGFMSSLLIARVGSVTSKGNSRLFTPKCETGNGLFATEEQAVEAAISFGEKVVDGKVGELTVADL